MSRRYEMTVGVTDYKPYRASAIRKAAIEEGGFDDWHECGGDDKNLSGWGESTLCGGETEYEFGQRLAKAIWKANGGPCTVELTAIYLEELPSESYTFSEENQDEWLTEETAPDHD